MAKKEDDAKEKELQRWRTRLTKSKKYQNANSKNWSRNQKLIYGKDELGQDTSQTVAYGFGLVKSLETSIYVSDPEGIAQAWDEAKKEIARRWTNVMSYDFGVMDLKSKGNVGLLDVMVNGYFACIETVTTDKAIRYPNEEAKEKKSRKKEEEPEIAIVSQNYDARRIVPADILFDPQGTLLDLSDHRYVFTAFYPTITSLREDPTFKVRPVDLDGDDIMSFIECSQFTRRTRADKLQDRAVEGEKDPDFKTICVWEVWDKVNDEILYITDDREKIIGRMPFPFRINIGGRKMFPITLMAFNPSPTGFYPTPEADLIANQLMQINEMDAIIYSDARTKWRKFVTIADVCTPEEAAKITDPNPANAIVILDKGQINDLAQTSGSHQMPDVNNLFARIQDPAPTQDLFGVRELCISEIYDIVGYGPPGRGGMPKTRSAREAVAIKEKMDQRLHLRSDAVTSFYQLFGAKHMQIVAQTLEVERYARVFVSDAQGYEYLRYTKDDIQGEFDYIVYAGSSMPKNTESRRASERELFNTMMPAVQIEGLPLQPLVERLAEAYQWKGIDQLFKNHKAILKQLATLFFAIQEQGVRPQPNVVLNLIGQAVMSGLNPAEINELRMQLQQAGTGGKPGMANPPGQRGDQNPAGTEMASEPT